MTENFPGSAGPTPERPEHSADQAAHQGGAMPPPHAGNAGAPEQSPWAPYDQPVQPSASSGQFNPVPGQEASADQWQQAAQPFGTAAQPAQPFDAQRTYGGFFGGVDANAGPSTMNLSADQPHGAYPAARRKGGRARLLVGVAVVALLIGGGAGSIGAYLVVKETTPVVNSLNEAPPAKTASNAPAGSITDVAGKVLPTVVEIETQEGEGSGIIVSSDGTIVTNNHVVASAAGGGRIKVDFQGGKTATATIIGRDPTTDVAVIKAQNVTGLPTAQIGRSDDIAIGQQVVAIGSPFQLPGTVTSGIISSLHRPVNVGSEQDTPQRQGGGLGGRGGLGGLGGSAGGQDQGQSAQATVLDAIQTDAAINPGNSGGPLVNMQGQVIGINSAISSPGSSQQSQGGSVGIGFAIPIDQAKRTAQQIEQSGTATQTVLGVTVQTNATDPAGAAVQSVTQGGAADQAGLKQGDVVVKLNDRAITTSDALVAAVHAQAPGDKVTLTLADGKTVTATLTGTPVVVQK